MNKEIILNTLEEMIVMFNREKRLEAVAIADRDFDLLKVRQHTAAALKIAIDGIALGAGVEIKKIDFTFDHSFWDANSDLHTNELHSLALEIA